MKNLQIARDNSKLSFNKINRSKRNFYRAFKVEQGELVSYVRLHTENLAFAAHWITCGQTAINGTYTYLLWKTIGQTFGLNMTQLANISYEAIVERLLDLTIAQWQTISTTVYGLPDNIRNNYDNLSPLAYQAVLQCVAAQIASAADPETVTGIAGGAMTTTNLNNIRMQGSGTIVLGIMCYRSSVAVTGGNNTPFTFNPTPSVMFKTIPYAKLMNSVVSKIGSYNNNNQTHASIYWHSSYNPSLFVSPEFGLPAWTSVVSYEPVTPFLYEVSWTLPDLDNELLTIEINNDHKSDQMLLSDAEIMFNTKAWVPKPSNIASVALAGLCSYTALSNMYSYKFDAERVVSTSVRSRAYNNIVGLSVGVYPRRSVTALANLREHPNYNVCNFHQFWIKQFMNTLPAYAAGTMRYFVPVDYIDVFQIAHSENEFPRINVIGHYLTANSPKPLVNVKTKQNITDLTFLNSNPYYMGGSWGSYVADNFIEVSPTLTVAWSSSLIICVDGAAPAFTAGKATFREFLETITLSQAFQENKII